MKRLIFPFIAAWILTSLFVSNINAQSTTITNGLSWLETQSNPDGSLGDVTSITDITRTTESSNGAGPVRRRPRLKYNTSLSSLREAKRRSNLLAYQGIATPFSMALLDL